MSGELFVVARNMTQIRISMIMSPLILHMITNKLNGIRGRWTISSPIMRILDL